MSDKKIRNFQDILKIIIVTPIVWFGTFGNNQICLNLTIFFSIFVGIVFFSYVFHKEKILEQTEINDYSNDFLNCFSWLMPTAILISYGWIMTGLLWFLCWCLNISIRKELKRK